LLPQRKTIIGVIVLVLGLTALSLGELSRAGQALYGRLTESAARGVRDRLGLFFSPALDSLNLAASWLALPQSETLSQNDFLGLMRPVLAEQKAVDMVVMSQAGDAFAVLARDGGGYLEVYGLAGAGSPQWLRLDADFSGSGAAMRDEPWLAALLATTREAGARAATGKPAWTGASRPGGGGRAIAATASFSGASGQAGYLTFSFDVEAVYQACREDLPTGRETILFFSSAGDIFDPRRTGKDDERPDSEIELKALAAWNAAGKPSDTAFSFNVAGRQWWAALHPLPLGEGAVFAGLAVSSQDLLGSVFSGGPAIAVIAASLVLVLGLLILLYLRARRLAAAGRGGGFFDTQESVLSLLGAGESETVEFKSTLRLNLATGKPGKEIELASLKTIAAFLNSHGGHLAVGVADDGSILGLDADGFEGDDHIMRHLSSLISRHLGAACAAYVRFGVRRAGPGKVLVVACAASPEPVFLRDADKEEFYVRMGPSSRKLSLSQFHEYVGRMGQNSAR
jgi:hypothetical protein